MRIANGLVASILALGLTGAFLTPTSEAATIVIVNNDGVGEGFNDPTVVAPVGGNPGTTVGAQRLFVFQYAANIWGSLLPSTVQIDVRAQFNPQTCTATSAVLGSAGPVTVSSDFAGAPFPAHWYHAAEANKLAGADLDAGTQPEINATFNSNLNGAPTCLGGTGWYLGVDGSEGANIELLPVVLHELGHGLGFSTVTNGSTGSYLNVVPLQPSIFDKFLYDAGTTTHWDTNTPAQRQASAVACGKLRWDGPAVVAGSPSTLGPRNTPILRIHTPAPVAGDYIVGISTTFGAPVTNVPVTGPVTLVNDGVAPINDGCEALAPGSLTGQIALVDRGFCGFAVKAKIAQDAGAIGIIICNNAAVCPPPGMGGVDPAVTIPAVMVSQSDGNLLKANALGQTASLLIDPTLEAGADAAGRVWMYSPLPFAGGSSVSHFDTSAEPNLLMEPFINNNLSSAVDLTLNQMSDIGWIDVATPIFVAPGHVQAATDGVRIEFYSAYAQTAEWTSYRLGTGGEWNVIGTPEVLGRGVLILKDTDVRAGQTYSYRLGGRDTNGEQTYSETVTVTINPSVALALHGAVPNPAGRECTVAYTLGGVSPAKIALYTVAGRSLRTIDLTGRGVGRHTVDMGAGLSLRPGTYFVRLTQGEKTLTRPVVIQ